MYPCLLFAQVHTPIYSGKTKKPLVNRNIYLVKKCLCPGGTPTEGIDCDTNGAAKCVQCDEGFYDSSGGQKTECSRKTSFPPNLLFSHEIQIQNPWLIRK